MRKNFKELIRKILMLVAVIVIIFSLYKIYTIKTEENNEINTNQEIIEIIKKEEDSESDLMTKAAFEKLVGINSDFKGYISYPSLNINEQVVQTDNNDYYLTHTFNDEYSVYGTAFIDKDYVKGAKNQTIYGHWINNSTLKFSNLHRLKTAEIFKEHEYFYYADDEFIYTYQSAIILYHDSVNDYDRIPYMQSEFSEEGFESFINNAKAQEIYDTGIKISEDDQIMTLQTCIDYYSDMRLVVIGKLIDKEPIK